MKAFHNYQKPISTLDDAFAVSKANAESEYARWLLAFVESKADEYQKLT